MKGFEQKFTTIVSFSKDRSPWTKPVGIIIAVEFFELIFFLKIIPYVLELVLISIARSIAFPFKQYIIFSCDWDPCWPCNPLIAPFLDDSFFSIPPPGNSKVYFLIAGLYCLTNTNLFLSITSLRYNL